LCTICEVVKNVVHNPNTHHQSGGGGGGILTASTKAELQRHRKAIRDLINRKTPHSRKKRILLKGRGVLPLILALAGPILGKLLFGG